MTKLPEDSNWPRAAHWLKPAADHSRVDLAVYGVCANKTSISPTRADRTPAAIRDALLRYSTYHQATGVDLGNLEAADFGDNKSPDSPDGEAATQALAARAFGSSLLSIALGGDNSVTYAAMTGAFSGNGTQPALADCGLITLDAHHDLREGVSNGSPVRRLIEAGLPGNRIVQIGINDFSNSPEYARRARELGILVIGRHELRTQSPIEIWQRALFHLEGVASVHVDFDVDVCDRAFVPACPAAAPGGISADELRQFAHLAGRTPSVRSMDITEIDAEADAPDQRTVRLGALLILEAAAGLALR
ncbi:MAG: hypothetical protein RLZZ400_496 [Actinomycetota bacterium]